MLILEKAIATELPTVAADYEQEGVRVLVAFCRELQRASADAPFYLSCRTASRLLGVDHNTAARWLRLLVIDGILLEVSKGGKARTARKASRYRYIARD